MRKGAKHTDEARAKMSASGGGSAGRKLTPEHRAKIAAAMTGKRHSRETLAKMAAAKVGIRLSPETRAKMSASRTTANAAPKTVRSRGWREARTLFPLPDKCERCEAPPTDRHHIDGDMMNNVASNIEFLCRSCHMKHHNQRRESPSTTT